MNEVNPASSIPIFKIHGNGNEATCIPIILIIYSKTKNPKNSTIMATTNFDKVYKTSDP